ncbi:MAG: sigma-70 family RNA polymerase sigma factor [Planctomycetes bacterium]|nr:sigma-70 family RNA polymerase sigma factor [Planctomycetota bacterium]
MAGRTITHNDLDEHLDDLARDLGTFDVELLDLAKELHSGNVRLEVTDPSSWRRSPPAEAVGSRVPLRRQFRTEVDSIVIMDREAEARLARRIELARKLLDLALADAGLERDALVEGAGGMGGVGRGAFTVASGQPFGCQLPPKVCRRWMELHALRTEMVERNLYLVLINVERYSHTTANQSDLIQEGCASLFRAVDGFDWKRGLLFRTYAVHWLNQAFRAHLYNFSHTVRVPVYLQKALKHVNDAKVRLGDPNASVESLARETGLGENLVSASMSAARSIRSMDATFDDQEEGGRLKDVLEVSQDEGPYTPALEEQQLDQSLNTALSTLSDRERLVIQKRFGLGEGGREHTLAEVASELGVSLERIRQIQVRALNKLRTPRLRKAIDPFLN